MQYAGRRLTYLIIATVLIALVWATFFPVDEITRGQGKIIPYDHEQVIQAADPGSIKDILVREGDTVKAGDVLLHIDPTRSESVYRESVEKWVSLSAQEARLKSEANGTPLVFPDEIKEYPQVIQGEIDIYNARHKTMADSVALLKQNLALTQKEIAMTAPLVNKGAMSEVELIRSQSKATELKNTIAERQNRYSSDAANELTRVSSELAQTRYNKDARKDAYDKTTITAPMDGIIKNIRVTTVGGVLQAGQDIMEIIPTEDRLLVESYVKPSDIAFISKGMHAVVKLSSYDYNKYGGLEGEIVTISPGSVKDESGQKSKAPVGSASPVDIQESYYRVLIKTNNSKMNYKGKDLPVLPGMAATVDIKTGKRTVLEYLFRPLQRINEAMTER